MGSVLAWLAKSALMQSPIGALLKAMGGMIKRVPWPVWASVALLAAIWLGARIHEDKSKAFGEERFTSGFKAGYSAAEADQRKAAAATDARTAAIAAEVKGKNDEANARTDAAAADLGLRGPGKARASCPAVPAAASGPQPPAAPADAGGSGLPADDGQAAVVPWGWLVSRAHQCDLDLNEVKAWREWYARTVEAWPKVMPVRQNSAGSD